jgi:hypothetical protein
VYSLGGLVAAVGLTLAAGAGLVVTLPGAIADGILPTWMVWLLRLSPIPALVLLYAVVSEATFKVRIDDAAIHFRRRLGGVVRVPWREVVDCFADCGRSPGDVVHSGGSMVHEPRTAETGAQAAPFARYHPDYTLVSQRGTFVFDDSIADVGELADEVVTRASEASPSRWEEGLWVTCDACDKRVAVSLWRTADAGLPNNGADAGQEPPVGGGPRCPACGRGLSAAAVAVNEGFAIETRGTRPSGVRSDEPQAGEGDHENSTDPG